MVGDRLHDAGVVVVAIALETTHQFVSPDPGGHGEQAQIIGHAALPRGDEVCQRAVRLLIAEDFLLTQHREPRQLRPT